jgi:DNA-binding transcriptional MerR regulator
VGYTAAQAAKLAGCSVSQLRYWSRSQLVAATADGGGYSFRDLVALRVVRSLLDAGLSSTRVHAALRWVRESGDDLASLRIVTDGRTVWACHDDGQILDALRAGQRSTGSSPTSTPRCARSMPTAPRSSNDSVHPKRCATIRLAGRAPSGAPDGDARLAGSRRWSS